MLLFYFNLIDQMSLPDTYYGRCQTLNRHHPIFLPENHRNVGFSHEAHKLHKHTIGSNGFFNAGTKPVRYLAFLPCTITLSATLCALNHDECYYEWRLY